MSLDLKSLKDPKLTKVKGVIRNRYKTGLLLILYIVVLIINGLDEFIQTGFNIEFLFSPEWWYKIFRVLVSNLLIFFGTLFYLIDKIRSKREDIILMREKLEKRINEKEDPTTFDIFINQFSTARKIMHYKKSLRREERSLDNKAKSEDIALWIKSQKDQDEDLLPKDPELKEAFLANKHCQKKRKIQMQMTEEFINDRIEFIKLKGFRPTSKAFVTEGTYSKSDVHDNYHVESTSEKLTNDLWFKFLVMIGALILLESIVMDFIDAESWWVALLGFMWKLIPLVIQGYMAIGYAEVYVNEKVKGDLRKRLDIMTLYVSWLVNKNTDLTEGGDLDGN